MSCADGNSSPSPERWPHQDGSPTGEDRFRKLVLANPINRAILERGHLLGVEDWWLTAGAVFQTVWNGLDGRAPGADINDYDVFYFDANDLSWDAEDAVIRRAATLFADLDVVVEVRNEARVHLWYEQHFGRPAAAFRSSRDAIDHFASTTCCYALTRTTDGLIQVYAPHGFDDLFARHIRPNPTLAPRQVYLDKTTRWKQHWPHLTIDPWPSRTSATVDPPRSAPTRTLDRRSRPTHEDIERSNTDEHR